MKLNYKKIINILIIGLTLIGGTVDVNPMISFRESFVLDTTAILFLLIFVYLLYIVNKDKYSNMKIAIIFGIVFSMFHLIGYGIDNYNSLNFLIGSFFCFVKSTLKFVFYTYVYTNIIQLLFDFINDKNLGKNTKVLLLGSDKRSFAIRTILIFLSYIPVFLYEYPGIFTHDSLREIYDGLNNLSHLVNHHPIFHVYLLSIFFNIGKVLFGTNNAGIAMCSIAQMFACSITFSYLISFLDKQKISNTIRIICFLFILLYPPFYFYSISLWKDVPFALAMVYFTVQTVKIFTDGKYLDNKYNILKIIISAIFVILFRNNGIYVVLLSFLMYIIFYKGRRKQMSLIFIVLLVFYIIFKGPVFSLLNVKDGPTREALSIPIQQVARTYVYKQDSLTEEEKKLIHKWITNEDITTNYNPYVSDNMKETFSEELFKENKMEFIGLWFKLFLKYPSVYFESFFIGSYGYWYPDETNWIAENWYEYGYNSSVEYQKSPLVNLKIVERIKDDVNTRKIPIISILFSIGFFFWMLLFLLAYAIYNKRYQLVFIFLPILFLWLTTIASPVWCEYRYIYSLFTTFPLLLATTLNCCTRKRNNKKKI